MLSDRDLELAKKHALPFTIDSSVLTVIRFSPTKLAAFLAERDQLAIKEKDDAVREALDLVFENCRVIYFPTPGEYPLEHNPHANKDSKAEIIRALIEPND